jgi:hypothetical protein
MKLLFKQRFFSWFDSYDIYDEAGNTVYTVKGELSWGHLLRIYDANGNETGSAYYDAEGIKRYETTFQYDEEGHCRSYIFCDTDGNIIFKAEDEYDDKGNRISSSEYQGETLICQSKSIYDKKGNKIRDEQYNQDGELVGKIEYEGHQTICLTAFDA